MAGKRRNNLHMREIEINQLAEDRRAEVKWRNNLNMQALEDAMPVFDTRPLCVYGEEENLTYPAPQTFSLPMRPQNADIAPQPVPSLQAYALPMRPQNADNLQANQAPLPQTPAYDHPAPGCFSPLSPESQAIYNSLYETPDDDPAPDLNYDDGPTDFDMLMQHAENRTGPFDPEPQFSPMHPSRSEDGIDTSRWPLEHVIIVDEFYHPVTGVRTYAMRALDEDYKSVGWDPVYAFWINAAATPQECIDVWEKKTYGPIDDFDFSQLGELVPVPDGETDHID